MRVQFISKYDTVEEVMTKQELVQKVRDSYRNHISLLSFQIDLNKGVKDFEVNYNTHIRIV